VTTVESTCGREHCSGLSPHRPDGREVDAHRRENRAPEPGGGLTTPLLCLPDGVPREGVDPGERSPATGELGRAVDAQEHDAAAGPRRVLPRRVDEFIDAPAIDEDEDVRRPGPGGGLAVAFTGGRFDSRSTPAIVAGRLVLERTAGG